MAPKKQKSKKQFKENPKKADEALDKVSDKATEPQDENQDSVEETQATVNTSESTKKRVGAARGVSAMYKVVVRKAQGKRAKIRCNAHGVPIGTTRSILQSYTGMLARTMIPIDYPNWTSVPVELKEKLWLDLKVFSSYFLCIVTAFLCILLSLHFLVLIQSILLVSGDIQSSQGTSEGAAQVCRSKVEKF